MITYKNSLRLLLACCLFLTQCTKEDPVPKSSAKDIESPAVEGIVGATPVFDPATSTYTVIVPGGTDLKAVKFTFALPTGATAKPASGTTMDFTNPITYTVTAEDGSTHTFTVKVEYRTTWATKEDRYDAMRIKAQKIAGVFVSGGLPGFVDFEKGKTVTDADAAYFINKAEFVRRYDDAKATVWGAVDREKLEYFSIGLDKATGEIEIRKGERITLREDGSMYSYYPTWLVYYTK